MITHTVILKPKAGTTDEEMAALFESIRALQKVTPGLLAVSVGKNHSAYHHGYIYGVIMHFSDEAHLQAHHPHPAHMAVVEQLDRLCDDSIDFDLPESFPAGLL
jgi:quinol monooxygenase YgiN